MNLCILDSAEEIQFLLVTDRRATHILRVLKKNVGESLKAGSPDGMTGTARIESVGKEQLVLRFSPEVPAPFLYPIHVLLGAVRPIQAARIVRDLTALGVSSIMFFPTELGEKSYLQSNFYREKEYLDHAREGAEQAGNPRLPAISVFLSRKQLLKALHSVPGQRFICHPDAPAPLGRIVLKSDADHATAPHVELHYNSTAVSSVFHIAIGTERGWTDSELADFEHEGFARCGLGKRILRTETAAIASVSVLLSSIGVL